MIQEQMDLLEQDDPLGFTKQTAMLLRGIGAADLLPQFRKRNISTEALPELTEEDLILLGASRTFAKQMFKELGVISRGTNHWTLSSQYRLNQLIEILKNGEQQLSLLQAFVAYARLRFVKDRINFYIDPNKNLAASQALYKATTATLAEIEATELTVRKLEGALISVKDISTKYRYKYICTLGGIGLIAFIVARAYFLSH